VYNIEQTTAKRNGLVHDYRRITGTNTVTESVALPQFHFERMLSPGPSVSNANPTGVFRALVQRDRSRRLSMVGLTLVHLEGVHQSLVFKSRSENNWPKSH
jgi:hypothetical protein